jgi:hypothetical protein
LRETATGLVSLRLAAILIIGKRACLEAERGLRARVESLLQEHVAVNDPVLGDHPFSVFATAQSAVVLPVRAVPAFIRRDACLVGNNPKAYPVPHIHQADHQGRQKEGPKKPVPEKAPKPKKAICHG